MSGPISGPVSARSTALPRESPRAPRLWRFAYRLPTGGTFPGSTDVRWRPSSGNWCSAARSLLKIPSGMADGVDLCFFTNKLPPALCQPKVETPKSADALTREGNPHACRRTSMRYRIGEPSFESVDAFMFTDQIQKSGAKLWCDGIPRCL